MLDNLSFPVKNEMAMTEAITTGNLDLVVQSDGDRKKLESAIAAAKAQYWLILQDWLKTTSFQSVATVVINGGAAHFMQAELKSYFGRRANWAKESMKAIADGTGLKRDPIVFRLADGFEFWKSLGGSIVE